MSLDASDNGIKFFSLTWNNNQKLIVHFHEFDLILFLEMYSDIL